MTVRLLIGDCRDRLRELPDQSAQCVVTSPPYFGLRDYGVDGQLGAEPTPQEFVAALREVFREVWRVLRDDGTVWLNLGDSYAGASGRGGAARVPNRENFLARLLKGGVLFYGRTDPRGRATQRIHVLIQDKAAPNSVLHPLLTAERVRIKDGQNDLCEVGGGLDSPVSCWVSRSLLYAGPDGADAKRVMDVVDNARIILTTTDLDSDAPFGIPPSFAVEDGETPFTIEVSGEPVAESIVSGVPALDTFTLYTGPERLANVDSVDEPVTLLDGSDLGAGSAGDFLVRKATSKQVTFGLHRGRELRVERVGHCFLLCGCILPYSQLLDEATAQRSEAQPKQELGIPEMAKRALMRDGWICRQTIIWHKPNPMPESVRDRCTKAHEYLFLLTKSPRYYFDGEAIKEPGTGEAPGNTEATKAGREYASDEKFRTSANLHKIGAAEFRNKRSVWTVSTRPYAGAHFATFPPALVEPCIRAGTAAGDTVLDPCAGSGTTGYVADYLQRDAVLVKLNPKYADLIRERLSYAGMFNPLEVA